MAYEPFTRSVEVIREVSYFLSLMRVEQVRDLNGGLARLQLDVSSLVHSIEQLKRLTRK